MRKPSSDYQAEYGRPDQRGSIIIVVRTAKLHNGATVLARDSGQYAGSPKAFANRTQARRWVDMLAESGQASHVSQFGRPFYVVLDAAN